MVLLLRGKAKLISDDKEGKFFVLLRQLKKNLFIRKLQNIRDLSLY